MKDLRDREERLAFHDLPCFEHLPGQRREIVRGQRALVRVVHLGPSTCQIGVLLPNNQRQHRILHIQKDVLEGCAALRGTASQT